MKKLFILAATLLVTLTLTACGTESETVMMNSKNALGVLSYISTSFLDETVEDNTVVDRGLLNLNTTEVDPVEPTTEIEEELEQVNIYMDKLKSFIGNGAQGFGSIEELESDLEEYSFMVRVTVEDSEFLLYYNIDILSNEISGIFILDGVEYTIEVQNNLMDVEEFEADHEEEYEENDEVENEETPTDDEGAATTPDSSNVDQMSYDDDEEYDDDEYDDEYDDDDDDEYEDDEYDDDEVKYSMTLTATNGEDTITINYDVKEEDDESQSTFKITKVIGGIEEEIEIKIKVEEDEYKLIIKEDGNEYKFEIENEDDGEIEYKLEYNVDGVEGEVKITEYTNELGETIYSYEVSEDGEEFEVEMEDPDEDDEDEEEDEEDEVEGNEV